MWKRGAGGVRSRTVGVPLAAAHPSPRGRTTSLWTCASAWGGHWRCSRVDSCRACFSHCRLPFLVHMILLHLPSLGQLRQLQIISRGDACSCSFAKLVGETGTNRGRARDTRGARRAWFTHVPLFGSYAKYIYLGCQRRRPSSGSSPTPSAARSIHLHGVVSVGLERPRRVPLRPPLAHPPCSTELRLKHLALARVSQVCPTLHPRCHRDPQAPVFQIGHGGLVASYARPEGE